MSGNRIIERFKKRFYSICLCGFLSVVPVFSQVISYYPTGEEFVGPFPSWTNVKTAFNAKGDGSSNDAAALNSAISSMKNTSSASSCVLYFPAGTYVINSTLSNPGRVNGGEYNGMQIIGEDPATTIIQWNGSAGGTMMTLDGWCIKVARLCFNGKGSAGVGLERNGGFSTYSEFSDLIFKDMAIGLKPQGSSGQGQAEFPLTRCSFIRCTNAGVEIDNWNTMDIWPWYCLFQDCRYGVHCIQGGFQMYESVFLRSTEMDICQDAGEALEIINNISIGSKCFTDFDLPDYVWTIPAFLQGNKIYGYTGAFAMRTGMMGDQMLMDNVFKGSGDNDTRQAVVLNAKDQVLVGNTFTNANPVNTTIASSAGRRYLMINQKIVPFSSIKTPDTVYLPQTPPRVSRKIFEVRKSTGDDANELQAQITAAVQDADPKPVVHVPKGNFSLKRTVVVPAGKAIQIVGDGSAYDAGATTLNWAGTGGPVLRLAGPGNRVMIRDMEIQGHNSGGADVIVAENCDQENGRIWTDQTGTGGRDASRNATMGLYVNAVEKSEVRITNGGNHHCLINYLVRGGSTLNSGGTTNGQVNIMGGSLAPGSNAPSTYVNVTNGGKLRLGGFRLETDQVRTFVSLSPTSKGNISMTALCWAFNPSPTVPHVNINGFNGTFTIAGSSMGQGYGTITMGTWFKVTGDGSKSNVLFINNTHFQQIAPITAQQAFVDNTSPAAKAAMVYSNATGGECKVMSNMVYLYDNITNKAANVVDTTMVLENLRHMRSLKFSRPVECPAGVTDIRLTRLMIWAGTNKTGLTFKGDTVLSAKAINTIPSVLNRSASLGLMGMGRSITIPTDAKWIAAYDLQGRQVFFMELTDRSEVLLATRQLEKIGNNSMMVVRIQQGEMQ